MTSDPCSVCLDVLGSTANFKLKSLVQDFCGVFMHMRQIVKGYEETMRFRVRFYGLHDRVSALVWDDPEGYCGRLAGIPGDLGKIRSLRAVMKQVYQLWVLKELAEGLGVSAFIGGLWWVKQGSEEPTCIGVTRFGEVSFWLEFQKIHVLRGLERLRDIDEPRPDIVLFRGRYNTTLEVVDAMERRGVRPDVLVECKEEEFGEWRREVDRQLVRYAEVFRPRCFILASLRGVPVDVKSSLQSSGILVVDELYPANTRRVKEFHTLVGSCFI